MERLETPRLVLRPVEGADASFLVLLMNDPGFLANIGDRGVRTEADAAAYLASAPLFDATDGLGYNLIAERNGGPVGICGLMKRDTLPHPDVGYAVLSRSAGRGYASEAASAVLAHGLGALALPCVLAITRPQNVPSRRVLEKIGMRLDRIGPVAGYEGDTAVYAAP